MGIMLTLKDNKFIPGMECDICKTSLDNENSIVQWSGDLQTIIVTCKSCGDDSLPYSVTFSSFIFNLCCNMKLGILKKPKKWNEHD